MSSSYRVWLEGAVVAALSMALSFVPLKFGPGFSISLGMIPITLYALRRGVKPALVSGLLWGLLHFMLGKAYVLTVSQAMIEYLFAYTFIGFAGIFKGTIQRAIDTKDTSLPVYLFLGTFTGVIARYICHFIAGFIFWGKYAIWGLSPVAYSLVMNGTSAVMTGITTYLMLLLIAKKSPSLFISQGN
ncbi:MAG: energy-coupled thiamine transporter ThiT [Vagococcus sp.]